MVPLWVYLSLGAGIEFTVTAVVAVSATVIGLAWQLSMMSVQHQLLDNWMAEHASGKSGKQAKQKSALEIPVVELSNVY
jgi:hypothetical protein